MSERYWQSGQPTERGIEVFTTGDCWILAYRLHQLTDWPIYGVGEGEWVNFQWSHYVVKAPNGLYLDVTGVSTAAELRQAWDSPKVRRISTRLYDDIALTSRHPQASAFPRSWHRALIMAHRLLGTYGIPSEE